MTTENTIKKNAEHICVACKASFRFKSLLKNHIRKEHFNRVGLVPHTETQKVNQVWYEKVGETNIIVEIKKISDNKLLIKKLNEDTTITPTELKHRNFDVRKQYPLLGSKMNKTAVEACRVCQKMFGVRLLSKHFAASHANYVKEECETCGATFKRLINCARHICPKNDIK
ncbi:hypothetical protein PYW07_012736 [Mythimna separata]|uniref:C2H2-type domain-containing protein n=1 Tax=Mythimna separata TaxID=271217 RepID=A0AAD8DLP8_MYTSE|nr:hypothetical protein PYW07_012736 [Mythimna separata]